MNTDHNTSVLDECDDGNLDDTDGCLSTCVAAACGDGVVQAGVEECDDSNVTDGDGCSSACVYEFCGDGAVNTDHNTSVMDECDDGNNADGDGCDSTCVVEYCGDAIVNNGEACDDGNSDNTDGCIDTCEVAACGDGFVEAGTEECDDANSDDLDACSNLCVANFCGDGVTNNGETCDDANLDDVDACNNACTINYCGDGAVNIDANTTVLDECDDGNLDNTDACLSSCVAATCGDGNLQTGTEECDDGNLTDGDGCNSVCVAEFCGDAIVNNGEACDDGGESASCNSDCTVSQCGDGVLNAAANETCDDSNTTGGDGCSMYCHEESTPVRVGLREFIAYDSQAATAQPDAAQYCEDAGGYLATIDNADELQAVINSMFGTHSWIGLTTEDAATFHWQNAAEPTFTAWDSDQPDTSDSKYCTVEVTGVDAWQTDNCGAAHNYVCAFDVLCGNGVMNEGESCDDGNFTNGDGCTDSCTVEPGYACDGGACATVCGDGLVAGGEQCDDHNTDDGDGCSSSCTEEDGFSCSGAPSTCSTTCGDTIVAGSEACDDGGESETCNATCTASVCGDSVRNATAGEACDDGNDSNNDGCMNTCELPVCGDGYVRAGVEACDDGNAASGDGCSSTCTVETAFTCTGTAPSACSRVATTQQEDQEDSTPSGGGRGAGGTTAPSATQGGRHTDGVLNAHETIPPSSTVPSKPAVLTPLQHRVEERLQKLSPVERAVMERRMEREAARQESQPQQQVHEAATGPGAMIPEWFSPIQADIANDAWAKPLLSQPTEQLTKPVQRSLFEEAVDMLTPVALRAAAPTKQDLVLKRAVERTMKSVNDPAKAANGTITRMDALVLIYDQLDMPVLERKIKPTVFKDTPQNSALQAVLVDAYARGLVRGDPAKMTFRPNDPVTSAELMKMIRNADHISRRVGVTGANK